jgi:polar amino acid transport system substrate-binding protein
LYPDFDYLPVPEELFVNRASHVFYTRELRDKYNVWLNIITKDGTFDEMYARWIGGSLPREEDIPRFELSGKNGTLKVVNTGNFPPFSYIDSNNEQVGFDAEMINRFAGYLGMNIEYAIMSYDGIVPYIASGRADMSACSFTVTDERSDALLFGAEFTKARAALIVPKSAAGQMTQKPRDYTDFAGKKIGGFTEWLKTGIERNLITDNRWKMVVNGLGVTMIIALFAQFFGTVFGSFVCWLLLRKNRFVSGVGKFYCGLIYRLPAVALLMVAY